MTTDAISPDLKTTLRRLKLGRMLDTLPERFILARQQKMPHQDLLLLVLSDEVSRPRPECDRSLYEQRLRSPDRGRVVSRSVEAPFSVRGTAMIAALTATIRRGEGVSPCLPGRRASFLGHPTASAASRSPPNPGSDRIRLWK